MKKKDINKINFEPCPLSFCGCNKAVVIIFSLNQNAFIKSIYVKLLYFIMEIYRI